MRDFLRTIIITFSILFLIDSSSFAQTMRVPAEWEPQDRVWLTWFGQERRDAVSCDIVEALVPHIKLTINVSSETMKAASIDLLKDRSIDVSKLDFVIDPFIDYFVRDYAVFVKDTKGKLQIVDFVDSSYGRFPQLTGQMMPEDQRKYGEWEVRLARQLNIPIIKSDYFFEGGGIESNGKGTLLVIRDMALQRNPDKSIAEIENELKRTLGARKIIWLEKGLIEDKQFPNGAPFFENYYGGGANMHIDELARFVNETTVVLPYIARDDSEKSPVDRLNYPMLEANFKILQKAKTADGKKLKIVRIPMPQIEQLMFTLTVDDDNLRTYSRHGFKKGDTVYRVPAASYANYFVSNNVVLIPKYWKEGMPESQKQKDEEVRNTFAQLFPNHQVVQIFTLGINRGGGGIHCATNQLPL
jgi:agmatine deiminase